LPEEELIPANAEERGLYVVRIVVERCLYGVDRNPLAVEMAKLSLWLLTLQRNRPFTFLDHAIRCGDSLLGVDLKQLSTWSLSGTGQQSVLFDDDLSFAADKREGLMKMQYRTGDQRRLLDAAIAKTRRLRAAADRLMATAFEANPEAAAAAVSMGLEEQEEEARKILKGRRPFHWPVEFPEVFLNRGGFDAIVGNPPFMGGSKISGVLGTDYREYLVSFIADNARGNADLCAYFLRRAFRILGPWAHFGLVTTKTIAEGDTRSIGLAGLRKAGCTLTRAVRSMKWPGEANLAVALIWGCTAKWSGPKVIDGSEVPEISPLLTGAAGVHSEPLRLKSNQNRSYTGSKPYGEGFILSPQHAKELLEREPSSSAVVFPYMNGEDLNSTPEQWPTRYIIDFGSRSLDEAIKFPDCFAIIERLVKPYRDNVLRARTRSMWWLHEHRREELYAQLTSKTHVLVCSEVTKHLAFCYVPTGPVFSANLDVFPEDDHERFCVLQSSIHEQWARAYSSHLETRLKYSPGNAYETFPFPLAHFDLGMLGQEYHELRRQVMVSRNEGLTMIYNGLHSPHEVSHDIASLRALKVEMDQTVAAAYGWTDLELGHGFHETKQGVRYTISEAARREALDRLLALNHERHAAEIEAAGATQAKRSTKRKKSGPEGPLFAGLSDDDN
jgi:hypothetical protein